MAPIRRYLRISRYSVLECRIYIDPPCLASTWLLNPKSSVLPRVIESVRPLVVPKLREETERARGKGSKGKKKGGIKDVVVEDDFEVSIFLKDMSTRHSVLTRDKTFIDRTASSGRGGLTSDEPVMIPEESDEDEGVRMQDVPAAGGVGFDDDEESRYEVSSEGEDQADGGITTSDPQRRRRRDSDDEEVGGEYVGSPAKGPSRSSKRRKHHDSGRGYHAGESRSLKDDKKKMGFNTSYDGFTIYERILCLIVKRRSPAVQEASAKANSGQAMMEEWIESTQTFQEDEDTGG